MEKNFLLFDLDGTIIDSQDGILQSVQYTLQQFGIMEQRESLRCYIGPPILDALMQFHHFSPEKAALAVPIYRAHYAEHGMEHNPVFEGVLPMLQQFVKRGKTLTIATSKPVEVATPILKALGLTGYFAFIGGSSLSGERPHKADVIRHVLQKLQITDLSKAVMIGDRSYDIVGAKQAGIASIGILYGYGNREELETAGADAICATALDLLDAIQ